MRTENDGLFCWIVFIRRRVIRMTIKCNFNGAIICSIVFIGGVAALFKVGIVDGTFNNVPFEEVTTEFLNYIFTKTKEEKND